eukprot:COSAG06_NODE_10212_length_1725_cov_3.840461_2_plen_82_part_00
MLLFRQGSNDGEHWTTPNRMGSQLNADTEESCTQYNILKVARHLFKWTASSSLGDFYERAIMNGIIGACESAQCSAVERQP